MRCSRMACLAMQQDGITTRRADDRSWPGPCSRRLATLYRCSSSTCWRCSPTQAPLLLRCPSALLPAALSPYPPCTHRHTGRHTELQHSSLLMRGARGCPGSEWRRSTHRQCAEAAMHAWSGEGCFIGPSNNRRCGAHHVILLLNPAGSSGLRSSSAYTGVTISNQLRSLHC